MSSIQVGNVVFESTGNNRLQYTSSNTVALVTAGQNSLIANSSITYVQVNGTSSLAANTTVSQLLGAGTVMLTVNSTAANVATNTLNLGTSSIVANGYSRLPNGLLMQWGTMTATVNNAIAQTATFSVAFNTLYSISLTQIMASAAAGALVAAANTVNTTAVVWKNNSVVAAAPYQMYYTAIGT